MSVRFVKRVMICGLVILLVVVYFKRLTSRLTNDNGDKIKILNSNIHGKLEMETLNRDSFKKWINLTSIFHKGQITKTANITVSRDDNTQAASSITTKTESFTSHETSITTSNLSNQTKDQLQFSVQARRDTERILRDSIVDHHMHSFIKPENEICEKRLPACIIIGVYKSGTQEIMDFLRLHPHITVYPNFSAGFGKPYFIKDKYYKRGKTWFKSKMPCSYSNQVTIMAHGEYFHVNKVSERVKQFNENMKLILMVREPFSRALSHYRFRRMIGLLNPRHYTSYISRNFSSFVLQSDNQTVNQNYYFVKQSIYDEPMLNWLRYFNLSQFLIIENEEFKKDPVAVLKKVEHFLGLRNYIKTDMFVFNHDKGFYCIQSNRTGTGSACYYANRGNKTQLPVPKSTESKLKDFFKEKNERFFRIIGKSYSWN